MSANNYSSSDEASSDDEFEEEQEEYEIAGKVGRPKKRKATVDPPMPVELLSSQKKRRDGSCSYLVIFEGEVFKRSGRADQNGRQQWRCVKNSEGCKIVIMTNQANICIEKSEGDHSHGTAKVDLDIAKLKRQIPILSTHDQVAPRQIYSNLIEFASRKVAALVNPLNVAQVVNYHRRKEDADPRLTANPEVMVVPPELQHYKNNLFVIYDSGPSPRRIMISLLQHCSGFLKIQNGGGLMLGETFVPCLHALLPKKSRRTYDHFFSAVEHLIPNARVGHAHMDYERGLISAFEHAHNLAEKHGCFAHFARALYRRVQKLGLVQIYKQEGRFSVLFDALKSLVYVPPDDVQMAYEAILTQCACNLDGSSIFVIGSAEKKFISYFEDVDLGGSYRRRSMFPINLWNCYALTVEGKSKTTNSLEAWHNSLKLALASADGKKPSGRFPAGIHQQQPPLSSPRYLASPASVI
uniref:FLYWCH-type domain-containing protein n=1 Tax=Ditylenchus dipsaci TaxID=166011 RepID=A0A915EF68_9BILA